MSGNGIHARAAGVLALVVLAALLPRLAAAAEAAGRAIFAVGDTVAVAPDGSERALARGDDVLVGDTLVTGRDGRVQVRFDDGGLLDLKPDSRFGVQEYREPAGNEGGSVLMRLFKGAMRTITGIIGRDEDDEYRVDTPVATIGIRGTEYELQYCDADCAGGPRARGLYGRTDDGAITVRNEHGARDFGAGQYFFVPPDGPPELLLTPPAGVLGGSEDGRTGRPGGDEDARVPGGVVIDVARGDPLGLDLDGDPFAPTFEQAEDRGEDAATRIRADGVQFAGAFGGSGTFGQEMFVSDPQRARVWIDGAGAVVEANFPSFGTLDASGMSLEEFGSTSAGDADVAWGRWAGDFTQAGSPLDGGFAFSYVDAADLTDPALLGDGTLGTIRYANPSGPAAVDQTGGLWNVDTLSISVFFTEPSLSLEAMQISSVSTNDTINFGQALGTINQTDLSYTITANSTDSAHSLDLAGLFIGETADGSLVVFSITEINGVQAIVGTQTLIGQ